LPLPAKNESEGQFKRGHRSVIVFDPEKATDTFHPAPDIFEAIPELTDVLEIDPFAIICYTDPQLVICRDIHRDLRSAGML
jgi:hypothetical protein